MRGKWTEGPWSLAALHSVGMYPNDGSVVILSANSVDPVHVAAVTAHAEFKRGQGHNLTNDPERDANAYLIAASPALADLAESVAAMRVYVNNPSAWDSFDEGISEMLRSLVADAEAALSLANPQPKGEEA